MLQLPGAAVRKNTKTIKRLYPKRRIAHPLGIDCSFVEIPVEKSRQFWISGTLNSRCYQSPEASNVIRPKLEYISVMHSLQREFVVLREKWLFYILGHVCR